MNKWLFKGIRVKGIPHCLTSRLAWFPSLSTHMKSPLSFLARITMDRVQHQPVTTSDLLPNFLFHPFFVCFKWRVINIGTRTTRALNTKQGVSCSQEMEKIRTLPQKPLAQAAAAYIHWQKGTKHQHATQGEKNFFD